MAKILAEKVKIGILIFDIRGVTKARGIQGSPTQRGLSSKGKLRNYRSKQDQDIKKKILSVGAAKREPTTTQKVKREQKYIRK